jgi:hypothetical protein
MPKIQFRHGVALGPAMLLTLPLVTSAGEQAPITRHSTDKALPSVTLVPALKDAKVYAGVLEISLEERGEGGGSCAAVAYFPYRFTERGPSAKTVPLRMTVSASPGTAAPSARQRGEATLPKSDGENRLLIRIEEGEQKDLDAYVEKLPSESREKVKQGLDADGGDRASRLRFDLSDPAQAGRCLALVVSAEPPPMAE